MKTMKRTVAACVAVVLGVACLMLSACGNSGDGEGGNDSAGKDVDASKKTEKKTYTNEYALADVAEKMYQTGYFVNLSEDGGTYVVTLELDGENYTLTKHIIGPDAERSGLSLKMDLSFAYSGTYTQEGDKVTLKVPEKCEWSEDWVGLEDYGVFISGSGTTEDEYDSTENNDLIFAMFNTEYLNLSETSSREEETVTLEGESISFAE